MSRGLIVTIERDHQRPSSRKEQKFVHSKKQHTKIMAELATNLKHSHYEDLKVWDRQRAESLKLHLQVIEQINAYVQKRMYQSEQYFGNIFRFLSDKAAQYAMYIQREYETNYSTLRTVQNEEKAQHKQDAVLFSQHNMSKYIVNKDSQIKKIYSRIANELQILAESAKEDPQPHINDILQQLRIQHGKLFQRNMAASQSCQNLSNGFHQQKSNDSLKSKIDLYYLHREFMRQARRQTEAQKQLGCQTIAHLQASASIQAYRLAKIEKLLQDYTHLISRLDPQIIPQNKSQTITDSSQYVSIVRSKLYAPALIFEQKILQDLEKVASKESTEFTIVDIQEFILALRFEEMTYKTLILKEADVRCKSCTVSNENSSRLANIDETSSSENSVPFQKCGYAYCRAVVTADWYFHLESRGEETHKIQVHSKINRQMAVEDSGELTVVLKWNSSSRSFLDLFTESQEPENMILQLLFNSESSKLEMLQFLSR